MKGFTLIETLVAVSILMIAMTGPILTAQRAYIAALIARDQLTASFLSQEGIEYVRAMRDDEYLYYYQINSPTPSTSAWTDFLTGSRVSSITQCRNGITCLLDPTNPMGMGAVGNAGIGAVEQCSGAGCTAMHINNGIYTQQNLGTQTSFKRTITVNDVPGTTTEVKVVVTVSWQTNHYTYSVSTTDHLTPWE